MTTWWNELSTAQKAVTVLAAVFLAGMVWAVALSEYRGLPAEVKALSVRVDADSAKIAEQDNDLRVLKCLILELFELPTNRRPEKCSIQ